MRVFILTTFLLSRLKAITSFVTFIPTSTKLPYHKPEIQYENDVNLSGYRRFEGNKLISCHLSNSPSGNNDDSKIISHRNLSHKNILVVGGSGRVGGSVVCQLLKHNAKVTVGGTKLESFEKSLSRWKTLYPWLMTSSQEDEKAQTLLGFVKVDREDETSVTNAILKAASQGVKYDLIVHTAGPFQGKVKSKNGVLEAAIKNGIRYIDVCDDYCTARAAKSKYEQMAKANGVPCIISTGCWPGVSSLMAKRLIQHTLSKNPQLSASDLKVDFSFFTAGSGGAGATLLVATFLILAEQSLKIVNGRRMSIPAMKDYSRVNFGNIVGEKDVAHLNLLEAASVHDILGVGNIQTLFGTAPNFWNFLLGLMARLPSSLLSDEELMEKLAIFSLPIVRLVDFFAGATNAMRCDVYYDDLNGNFPPIHEMALYAHENLEPCVGECVAAFCAAILASTTNDNITTSVVSPGVWFPEEAILQKDDIVSVLEMASVGAHTNVVESDSGLSADDVWGFSMRPIK